MAKWCWEGQAATIGKVCWTYRSTTRKFRKTKPQSYFLFLLGRTLGQVISAAKEEIIKAYYPGYFMQSVGGQIQTKQVESKHDDSYQGKRSFYDSGCFNDDCTLTHNLPCQLRLISVLLSAGYSVAVGEFSGDQVEGKSIK